MYKSIIDFLEIGKDKTAHWLIRCQDVFLGIFLFAGGILQLIFGLIILLTDYQDSSIVLCLSGFAGVVLYVIARIRGKYGIYFSWITCIGLALAITGLLFTKEVQLAGLLCLIFPLVACILFHIKLGSIISIIMLVTYFGSGLLLDNSPPSLMAFFFVGIVVLIVVSVFLTINEEIETASDHKISDIQKEAIIKNEFISQLSHQIRTPLNNIVVIGNLLNDTQLNLRQKDWMETIHSCFGQQPGECGQHDRIQGHFNGNCRYQAHQRHL